jgi:hypothetical protein
MKARLFTILPEGTRSSNVKHYRGMPPELTGGKDARREIGPAYSLVIKEMPDGVFLYRFDSKGECVGDTWHMNLDDANHQASYEFEGVVLNWKEQPQAEDGSASRHPGPARTPGAPRTNTEER